MPIVKISLTEEEMTEVLNLRDSEDVTKDMTVQDFFRFKLLEKRNPSMFTPEEAVSRALEKFTVEDAPFTLPDIYGDEWLSLNPRMTGVFGKRFFKYVENLESIEYHGMSEDSRRATYIIKGVQ